MELKKYLRSRMEEPESVPAVAPKRESVLPSSGDSQQAHEMQQFKTMDYRSGLGFFHSCPELTPGGLTGRKTQLWSNWFLCWTAGQWTEFFQS